MNNKLLKFKYLYPALLLLALFAYRSLTPLSTNTAQGTVTPAQESPSHKYSNDDLVLFGKSPDGKVFLLDLSFNVKEEPDKSSFIHYNFASLIFGEKNESLYDYSYDIRNEIIPYSFLKDYKSNLKSSLAGNNELSLKLSIAGEEITVNLTNLHSDFIVRNLPEYTKYIAEGKAEIEIAGKRFSVNAVLDRSFSNNYEKYIFFPGYDKLRSRTQGFKLWDEQGNFYLIDQSIVEEENPYYNSHTWVLYKNAKNNFLKRSSLAEITKQSLASSKTFWEVQLNEIENSFLRLELTTPKYGKENEGIAQGSVSNANGTFKITGFYFFDTHPKS